jgi:hypothetical protein
VRRREWLGRRNADERRDTDDTDAIDSDGDRSDAIDSDSDRSDTIDSDGDRSDAIDRDRHGVPNDNRGRGDPATGHDDDHRCYDNVWWSQSRRSRGGGCRRGVAGRRIE